MKKHNSRKKANAKKKQMLQQSQKANALSAKLNPVGRLITMEIPEGGIVVITCGLSSGEEAANVRDNLFAKSEHCAMCSISQSGQGIVAWIKVDGKGTSDLILNAVRNHYSKLLCELLGRQVEFDTKYIQHPDLQ